ncbi:MAG: hypothetical protein M3N68_14710 [Actinomycetota bacterium]|nr:hypothetical protein [Actinomycetota bacterium]
MPDPRSRSDERGLTVVELVVTMAVLAVVVPMALTLLDTVQRGVVAQQSRSDSTDQARLAAQQVDRQIRSGNVLYQPESGGMSLRVYTQANASQKCVQWRVLGRQLQWRSWTTTWLVDGDVSPWRVAADDVVNANVVPPVPVFALDTSQVEFGQRIMRVSILVNDSERAGRPVRIDLSVTGRNTQSGSAASACSDVPPA